MSDHPEDLYGDAMRDLASHLWASYPDGGRRALLEPSETFPFGALLGRFQLDPSDDSVVSGVPVDILADGSDGRLEPVREQLLERALQAAALSDATIDGLLDAIDRTWCGPWDAPWQVFGLVSANSLPVDMVTRMGLGLGAGAAVRLVAEGSGHPAEGLQGLIAPPTVFGLVLVTEGFERDDAGRRIGEIRMFLVVLADGRFGLRHTRRTDSEFRPSPGSLLGGRPITDEDVRQRDGSTFASSSYDALAGAIPEALARVLQIAVEPAVNPFEIVLRLLARSAVVVAAHGGSLVDVARMDPTTVACVGRAVLGMSDQVVDGPALVAAMQSEIESLTARVTVTEGDWLDDETLRAVERSSALHGAAAAYRVGEGVDDVRAAWLGSELLAGRAAEAAGPVADSLRELAFRDRALAVRVAAIVEHRRAVWGVEAEDDAVAAVRMLFAGARGRNDPCPCGSGRKFKRCCMR